MPLIVALYSKF
uniref:Uncharacterized protein n=1 Tax=Arundo donax TaxID=35708 RepID=A0A0A9BCW1_ARUDO